MSDQERWLQCLRDEGFNPFRSDAVGTPWDGIKDVPLINEDASDTVKRLVSDLQYSPQKDAQAVVIHGFAGSGKSHLLSRIRNDLSEKVYFTYVMPMAGNHDYWKYLQKQIINSLLRRNPQNPKYTYLHYLICRGIQKTISKHDAPDSNFFNQLESNPTNLLYYINQDSTFIDRAISSIIETVETKGLSIEEEHLRILTAFLNPELHQAAKKWLRCLGLENEECTRLGISQDYANEEFDDSMARQFIIDLFSWSSFDRPIVLCFDQLDFYTQPTQVQKLDNYIQFVTHIVNFSKNVLCISCVLRGTLEEIYKRVDPAAKDKLLKHLLPLEPIEEDYLIKKIIQARLNPLHENGGISDDLFPFDSNFHLTVKEILIKRNIEIYPRHILHACAEKYDEILSGKSQLTEKNKDSATFLQETFNGRKDFFTKENSQVIDEGMEEEQVRRLLQCVIEYHKHSPIKKIIDCRSIPMKQKPWDFEIQSADGLKLAVEICEHGSNSVYARKLGALLQAWTLNGIHSVFWIRRGINQIRLGPLGKERTKELTDRGGFLLTDWSEDEWNAIAALIWILNEADGGNLLLGYNTISMKQVETWIATSNILETLPVMNSLLKQKADDDKKPIPEEKTVGLDMLVQELETIVHKHRIIVFDKAFDHVQKVPQLSSVTREQCLKGLGQADKIESNTMQNTQILYWTGS
jgi:hypothetical protein